MIKKLLTLMLAVSLALALVTAHASEASPYSTPHDGQVDYRWRVASKSPSGTTTRGTSSVLFYVGSPASRDGETDTCGTSASYNVEVSGTFQISAKSVASSLGLTIGKSYSFNASKTSAPLKKGEYVKAYYTKNWQRYTIKQERIKHTTWYSYDDNGNPTGIHSKDEVVGTAKGYIYKPIMPKITLKYYKSNSKSAPRGSTSAPYKTETYEWNGNSYVITQTQFS